MTRRSGACLGTLLLTLAALCASAASPKRVLILDPFEREVAPYSAVVSAFRNTLVREFGSPLDIYELPLDLARFSEAEGEAPLVAFLEGRLKRQPVDLVVPIGSAGLQFAARHRERLFPDTPVLVLAAQARLVPPDFLRTNATLVTQKVNLPGMIEDILQVQPQTTNIVVVFGASALERFWVNECKREFQSFTNRVGFTWLNDLSLEQILQRCAAVPPRSFILHGLFVVDAAGIPCEKNEALRRLHQVANAPLFGYYASELGLGTIGGRLYQDSELGVQGARTAIRILRGERPDSIPPKVFEAAAPVFDWRELQRWGVSEARLPAGSVIRFRQAGFWELYRWPIAGTVLFCLLQAALIIGLLVNRAKRRQGEAEAALIADISSKFVNLPASEVDREIMDAERRICEFLEVDFSALWQWSDEPPGRFMLTHYYSVQEGPQLSKRLNDRDYPWFVQQFLAGRTVAISSLDELPAEAAPDREVCRQHGVKSNLSLPLSVGGKPVGILGLNTTRAERDWPDSLVQRLQLVAQIFANALARKRSDQALRESEERMTLAADAAELGVWGWNIPSNQVWGSDRWLRLFGFASGDQVSFERVMQRIHPDDRATVEHEVRRTLADRSDYAGEFRVVLPDGTQRWIASRGRGYPDANGTPARMLGAAIDVTGRKQAQENLARLLRQNELILSSAAEGILGLDLQGNHLFINPAASRMLGYEAEELLGRHSHSLWHHTRADGSPYPKEECKICASFAAGTMHRESTEVFWRKDGTSFPVEYASTPIYEEGRLLGAVVTFEDITERKRAELEAQELRRNLAHAGRVTLLGQLASALAHELSQPLGAILRNAEAAEIMLQTSSPDLDELRAIVTDILSDDKRAGQVIERLRSLLKRRSLDLQPIELPSVIAEVMSLVRADAAARQVKLAYSAAPNLPRVQGDRIHLQQVLLNLLVNALDALDGCAPDRRSIQVSARQPDPATVEVRVVDHGPGIPAESHARLFEPFFTTKAKGMGMGLAVSRTIIEAHKGKLWVENPPEDGACFCFTLRAASVREPAAGDP
jgi:PAS domain S-box-containing protein